MAIDLKFLDYAFEGGVFCDVPAKETIDLQSMNYAYEGAVFVSNSGEYIPPTDTWLNKVSGVSLSNLVKVSTVALADIKSVGTVEKA